LPVNRAGEGVAGVVVEVEELEEVVEEAAPEPHPIGD
jgi:hypothetical protein